MKTKETVWQQGVTVGQINLAGLGVNDDGISVGSADCGSITGGSLFTAKCAPPKPPEKLNSGLGIISWHWQQLDYAYAIGIWKNSWICCDCGLVDDTSNRQGLARDYNLGVQALEELQQELQQERSKNSIISKIRRSGTAIKHWFTSPF